MTFVIIRDSTEGHMYKCPTQANLSLVMLYKLTRRIPIWNTRQIGTQSLCQYFTNWVGFA